MRHEFHPEALAEYEEAARYYTERAPRVAEQFVAEVEAAIDRILESPTRWRVIEEDVRRCLTHVFPSRASSCHNLQRRITGFRDSALLSRFVEKNSGRPSSSLYRERSSLL